MKIVICLTGDNFKGSFVMSWTKLFRHLLTEGYEVEVRKTSGGCINHTRELILINDLYNGKTEKIFDGLDYDYMLWIDSDQTFSPAQFEMLLEHDKDIVSAVIKTLPAMQYACGSFINGIPKRYDSFKREDRLVECDFVGFGFLLVKKGVFEKIGFPFFKPVDDEKIGYLSEDFSFCKHAKEKGFRIFADTKCRVGHVKEFEI